MALTITRVKPKQTVGSQYEITVDVTFDSSYPTNGESFTPNDVDPQASSSAAFVFVDATQKTLGNRVITYNYTNSTLQLWTALGTEAANASDQSTIIARCQCRWGQVT